MLYINVFMLVIVVLSTLLVMYYCVCRLCAARWKISSPSYWGHVLLLGGVMLQGLTILDNFAMMQYLNQKLLIPVFIIHCSLSSILICEVKRLHLQHKRRRKFIVKQKERGKTDVRHKTN